MGGVKQLMMIVLMAAAAACGGAEEPAATPAASVARPAPAATASGPAPDKPRLAGEESGLVPPDEAVAPGEALSQDEIALAFSSRKPVPQLLAWYRSNARRGAFTLGSELEEGAEHVLSGSTRTPRGDFTVRLAPGDSGGTEAMVLITGRR